MSKFSLGNTKASRLTAEIVYSIRERYANRDTVLVTQDQLAREYQVSLTTIRNILNGVTWQNVPHVQSNSEVESELAASQRRVKDLLLGDIGQPFTDLFPEDDSTADAFEEILRRRASEPLRSEPAGTPAGVEPSPQSDEGDSDAEIS